MAYSIEEQETILNYDVQTKTWYCYSVYPYHVQVLTELAHCYNGEITPTPEGCVKVTLPKNAVKFKKPASARRIEQGKKLAMLKKMQTVQ